MTSSDAEQKLLEHFIDFFNEWIRTHPERFPDPEPGLVGKLAIQAVEIIRRGPYKTKGKCQQLENLRGCCMGCMYSRAPETNDEENCAGWWR